MTGHVDVAGGVCRRLGCQTVGLEDSLETAALALIVELAAADPEGDLTPEIMVIRAQRFLRERGLCR